MRVQKLIDRYEAQFLKKKDRKVSIHSCCSNADGDQLLLMLDTC